MYDALKIAQYFIYLTSLEVEDFMTNLKLQKLLYYAQGFHLALYGKPLFHESLEAWQYGPVVPEVYRFYKPLGSNPLPLPDEFSLGDYNRETVELLDEIYEVYGQYTAPALMHFTHQEPAWKKTPVGETISHSLMKTYFETQLVSQ